jgi:hypothetical protein
MVKNSNGPTTIYYPYFKLEDLVDLHKSTKDVPKLGYKQYQILSHFIKYPLLYSAYQVYNPGRKQTEYKNMLKRQNDLKKYGLIDREEHHKSFHHKLNAKGIYYLFSKYENLDQEILQGLFTNYGDHILFQLFVYPHISHQTLLKLQDSSIFTHLSTFLHNCCKKVEEAAIPLDKEYNSHGGDLTTFLFDLNDLTNRENVQRLYSFLKETFNWGWVDKANLRIEYDGTLVISYRSNIVLIIRSEDNSSRAVLTFNGKKKYEFSIFNNRFIHVNIDKYPRQYILLNLSLIINSLVGQFIFSIISDYAPTILHPAFQTLGEDQHFINVLQKIKRDFDNRYNIIIKKD